MCSPDKTIVCVHECVCVCVCVSVCVCVCVYVCMFAITATLLNLELSNFGITFLM